jgi:hypothetical protein
MATAENPLTKLYTAIWTLLEDDNDLAEIVEVGNCVKYDSDTDRNPLKEQVATSDLPEVVLLFDGAAVNLHNTSSSSRILARYQLVINAGDYRLNVVANQINWLIICNFARWQSTLTELKWKNLPFVKCVRLNNAQVGESDPQRNRQIRGWVTIWQAEIECHIKTSDLVFTESP